MSRVALTSGGSRAENVEAALRLIDGDIDLAGKSGVFIKPNLVSTTNQLAATHVDALRAVLGFVRQRYQGRITIGESTITSAWRGYENFGYLALAEEYDVEFVDLNEGQWVPIQVYNSNLSPIMVRFSRQLAESDYRISVCPAKTHDTVILTLSIKNLAMGGVRFRTPRSMTILGPSDKRKIHQGYPAHNLNLYLLASAFPPHLSVIDGYVGMEGNGPMSGDPVRWGVAIASQDPVAADCLAAYLMGFDTREIGYLWYCYKKGMGAGRLGEMEILGSNPQDCCQRFQPPSTYEAQKGWRSREIDELLQI